MTPEACHPAIYTMLTFIAASSPLPPHTIPHNLTAFPPPPLRSQLVTNKWFEYTMLTFIAASSLELCFDDYHVEPGSVTRRALHVMDILFTVVFGMEAVFKILVLGLLFNGPSSYMRRWVHRGWRRQLKDG